MGSPCSCPWPVPCSVACFSSPISQGPFPESPVLFLLLPIRVREAILLQSALWLACPRWWFRALRGGLHCLCMCTCCVCLLSVICRKSWEGGGEWIGLGYSWISKVRVFCRWIATLQTPQSTVAIQWDEFCRKAKGWECQTELWNRIT